METGVYQEDLYVGTQMSTAVFTLPAAKSSARGSHMCEQSRQLSGVNSQQANGDVDTM